MRKMITIKKEHHDALNQIKRELSVKDNKDYTLSDILDKAIEKGIAVKDFS